MCSVYFYCEFLSSTAVWPSCSLLTDWIKKTYVGIDFPHSDIRKVITDGVESCQRTCTEDPSCQYFSIVSKYSIQHNSMCINHVILRTLSSDVTVAPFSNFKGGVFSVFSIQSITVHHWWCWCWFCVPGAIAFSSVSSPCLLHLQSKKRLI